MHNAKVTLAKLITERQQELGGASLRELVRRAAEAGHEISVSTLSVYKSGKRTALPEEPTRVAMAAALGVPPAVVNAAAIESAMPALGGSDAADRGAEGARAWAVLTEGRSAEEVAHLLSVARTVLQGLDAQKEAQRAAAATAESAGSGE